MTRLLFLLGVTAAAGKILVRDKRIPRPVRWVLMLTVVCLWIPGPVDEVVILLTFGLVVVFWRQPLREAWAQARTDREKARERRSLSPSRRERVKALILSSRRSEGLRSDLTAPKGSR